MALHGKMVPGELNTMIELYYSLYKDLDIARLVKVAR
jgi:hypothetical protein